MAPAEAPAASRPVAMGGSSSGGRLRPPAKLTALDWTPVMPVSEAELAKRKAARAAAQAVGAGVLAAHRAAKNQTAKLAAARSLEQANELERTVSSLRSRCERAAEKAGLDRWQPGGRDALCKVQRGSAGGHKAAQTCVRGPPLGGQHQSGRGGARRSHA